MSSEELIRQLKRDEGSKKEHGVHVPYRDSLGFLTIGYGHNLDAKGISEPAAELILAEDLTDAKIATRVRFPWAFDLDPARRDAILNLVFNMGAGGLATFKKFLAAMQAGDWTRAGAELMDSKYAQQVGSRAHRLKAQIETGAYQ